MSGEIGWQMALLLSLTLGVPGLIMLAVGIVTATRAKGQADACTAVVTGYVSDHRFFGSGDTDGIAPVVSYVVGGRRYEVMRRFRSVSSMRVSLPWGPPSEAQLWVTPDDVLHVRSKGSRIDFFTPARRLWPVGMPMPVYYNPDKPWQAYAEVKNPTASPLAVLGMVLIGVGAMLLFVLAPMLFFLLQR